MTNADRIRKMSDEELVALFCAIDPTKVVSEGYCTQTEWAVRYNNAWLKESAGDPTKFWEHFDKVLSAIKPIIDQG